MDGKSTESVSVDVCVGSSEPVPVPDFVMVSEIVSDNVGVGGGVMVSVMDMLMERDLERCCDVVMVGVCERTPDVD